MAKIKIDYDGLNQESGNLTSRISDYNAMMTKLRNLTEQISQGWKGDSGTSYVGKMNDYYNEGNKLIDVLNLFNNNIKDVTATFSQTDSECAASIMNSF